jgi:hypothetical protein
MKKIFVGNLDFGATEESLHSLFAPHGTVERVNLVTDRETGRSRVSLPAEVFSFRHGQPPLFGSFLE